MKRAAADEVHRLLEQDERRSDLWENVEDWLIATRLSADSVWEEELHEDDWAMVAGAEPDFWRNTAARKLLRKLIRRRLKPEKKLDTVLRAVAHWYGLDADKLKSHRDKGASTERRRKKRGE